MDEKSLHQTLDEYSVTVANDKSPACLKENFPLNFHFFSQLSGEDQRVILVGGGSILVDAKHDRSKTMKGASEVLCPKHYQVAFHFQFCLRLQGVRTNTLNLLVFDRHMS